VPQNRQLWTGLTPAAVSTAATVLTSFQTTDLEESNPIIPLKLPTIGSDNDRNVAASLSSPPAKVYLHRTALLQPQPRTGDPPRSRRPGQQPPPDSPGSQFELLLHPDYRQPPPRRQTSQPGAPALYSSQSQLPVTPLFLYDLVFAIRRRRTVPSGWRLRKIFLEVPVADKDDDKPVAPGDEPREPLLATESYAGRGLQILSDPRFVAMLESGMSSDDGKACLRISLVPRSGQAEGTMVLGDGNDPIAAAVSVRLAEVRLAPIVNPKDILLAAPDEQPMWRSVKDGVVFIKMTEQYEGEDVQCSWSTTLKTNEREKDTSGNER
jgi:hypothetical protein